MRFSVVYSLKSLLKHKKRSFATAVGFMIGVCMVTAFMTWNDTGTVVFAKDHLQRDYQLIVTPPSWKTAGRVDVGMYQDDSAVSQTYSELLNTCNSIRNDSLVGKVEFVQSAFSLFNTENKSDDYMWYRWPLPIKTEGDVMVNASVFIVNDSFLELIHDELSLFGDINIGKNDVLMSRSLIEQINKSLGIEHKVGSKIDFAIITRLTDSIYVTGPAENENKLKSFERVFFNDMTVAGTYDWAPKNSYMADVLSNDFSIFRTQTQNWLVPILVWSTSLENSMFVSSSLLDEATMAKITYAMPPTIFVQVNPDEVIQRGITNLEEEASELQTRISYINTALDVHLLPQIGGFIDAYTQSRTLLIYVVPAVGLSVSTTILGSEVTFKERRIEVGTLRSKGTTYRQLYAIYFIELLALVLIGSILGFVPGIFLGCVIPATTGFLQYDVNVFREFLANITISPYTFVFSIVACGVVPLLYALYKANSYASTEIIKAMELGIREGEKRESPWPYILLMMIILWVTVVVSGYNTVFAALGESTLRENIVLFVLCIAQWVAFGVFAALILTKVLPVLSRFFAFTLKTRSKLVTLDLQRQKIFTSLIIVLILVSSIMVFSLVEAETTKSNVSNEIRYAIGADLRISTISDQPASFAQNLEDNFTMLENVMPIFSSYGGFADSGIRIIGVDPLEYGEIAFWSPSSLVSPTYEQALDSLAQDPSGVIISNHITNALHLDLGDKIKARLWVGDYQYFNIVGIMHSAPGFGEAEPSHESVGKSLGFEEERFIIVNSKLLTQHGLNKTNLFFASLKAETTEKEAFEKLSELPEVNTIYSPATFNLKDFDVYRFLYLQGVSGTLIIQFLAATLIGIVSLVLYLDYIVSGRSEEYAVMRAVGATRKNVAAIIFIESVEIIALSLVIGSLLGITYSMILFNLLLLIFPFSSLVPYVIVIPIPEILLGFGVVLLAMIIGSVLPARKAGRTNVAAVLRNL